MQPSVNARASAPDASFYFSKNPGCSATKEMQLSRHAIKMVGPFASCLIWPALRDHPTDLSESSVQAQLAREEASGVFYQDGFGSGQALRQRLRSIMVRAAPTSARRIARIASTSMMIATFRSITGTPAAHSGRLRGADEHRILVSTWNTLCTCTHLPHSSEARARCCSLNRVRSYRKGNLPNNSTDGDCQLGRRHLDYSYDLCRPAR